MMAAMNWPNCPERCEKNWSGGDPECAFRNGDTFEEDWNCGLVGKMRAIVYAAKDAQYDYDNPRAIKGVTHFYGDDCSTAVIKIDDDNADLLWMAYYKNRGRTSRMLIIPYYDEPRVPTATDLQVIAARYADLLKEARVEVN